VRESGGEGEKEGAAEGSVWGKGTRRVQLVRRDGRDVSTLYGRGGGTCAAPTRVTNSSQFDGRPARTLLASFNWVLEPSALAFGPATSATTPENGSRPPAPWASDAAAGCTSSPAARYDATATACRARSHTMFRARTSEPLRPARSPRGRRWCPTTRRSAALPAAVRGEGRGVST